MTMKPRAKKFRIRRAAPLTVPTSTEVGGSASRSVIEIMRMSQSVRAPTATGPTAPVAAAPGQQAHPTGPGSGAARADPVSLTPNSASDDPGLFHPADDGFGPDRFPTALNPNISSPQDVDAEAEQDAIRRESLTGRQLRMARRMAQKYGLPATSDFDAVRLLRRQGIDPFQRSNMLELVVPDDPSRALQTTPQPGPANLPQTVRPAPPPSKDVRPEVSRVQDIMTIQRDLAKRRRRKSLLLTARLAFFIALPTVLAAIYFYTIATPLYATRSAFVITQAEAPGASAMGGLFSGTAFATATDSINVQDYLESRDAMQRLDADQDFKAHFSQTDVDALQRLEADATDEAAYRLYKRNVKIGFDPTEGIIRMEVIALDPQVSASFSKALISYAEQQVDQLTQRVREDQMQGARESFTDAEANMLSAQRKVVDLQETYKVLNSEVELSMLATQISTLQSQLTQEQLTLDELLANANPSKARVDPVRNRIANLEEQIAATRAKMTVGEAGGLSLAQIQSELLAAQADVQTRQLMLASALESMETARVEANRQVRYLSVSVNPVAPDEPTYPRAFEDTFMAFMIFAGIYLMLSMTASILREQVSA